MAGGGGWRAPPVQGVHLAGVQGFSLQDQAGWEQAMSLWNWSWLILFFLVCIECLYVSFLLWFYVFLFHFGQRVCNSWYTCWWARFSCWYKQHTTDQFIHFFLFGFVNLKLAKFFLIVVHLTSWITRVIFLFSSNYAQKHTLYTHMRTHTCAWRDENQEHIPNLIKF